MIKNPSHFTCPYSYSPSSFFFFFVCFSRLTLCFLSSSFWSTAPPPTTVFVSRVTSVRLSHSLHEADCPVWVVQPIEASPYLHQLRRVQAQSKPSVHPTVRVGFLSRFVNCPVASIFQAAHVSVSSSPACKSTLTSPNQSLRSCFACHFDSIHTALPFLPCCEPLGLFLVRMKLWVLLFNGYW